MITQVKCLKCGELGVQRQTISVDRKSGLRIGLLRNLIQGGIVTLFGGLLTWIAFAFASMAGAGALLIFLPVAGLVLALGISLILRYLTADKATLFRYHCAACGHRWEQWEDGWDTITCPKCSRSMVTTLTILLDPETGKQPSWGRNVFGGTWAAVIGIAIIGATIPMWLEGPLNEGLFGKLMVAALGLGFALWGVSAIAKYFGGKKVKLFKHQCAACGYQWERREDAELQAA
jgi:hypothetical protein